MGIFPEKASHVEFKFIEKSTQDEHATKYENMTELFEDFVRHIYPTLHNKIGNRCIDEDHTDIDCAMER